MISAMGDTAKWAIGFMICCVVIGPILIITGITMLLADNGRAANVATYNDGQAAYTAKNAAFWKSGITGTANLAALQQKSSDVAVKGNMEGVNAVTTSFLYAQNAPVLASITLNLNVSSTVVSLSITDIPASRAVADPMYCTKADCDNKCHRDTFSCRQALVESRCNSYYLGSYTSGSKCRTGEKCGTCTYVGRLQAACVPLTLSGYGDPAWVIARSTKFKSCVYPFANAHHYGRPSNTYFSMTLVDDQDPRLLLSKVTEGTDDFGKTAAEQRNTGLWLVVVGCIITACVVGGIVYLVTLNNRQKQQAQLKQQQEQEMQNQPDQQDGYAENNQQQQGYNNQQQQGYPQQQGGYQQQPQQQGYPPQQQGGYQQQQVYAPQQQQQAYPQQQPQGYPPQKEQPVQAV
jgi:hypothetical protein